jgi:hypothetical protein
VLLVQQIGCDGVALGALKTRGTLVLGKNADILAKALGVCFIKNIREYV